MWSWIWFQAGSAFPSPPRPHSPTFRFKSSEIALEETQKSGKNLRKAVQVSTVNKAPRSRRGADAAPARAGPGRKAERPFPARWRGCPASPVAPPPARPRPRPLQPLPKGEPAAAGSAPPNHTGPEAPLLSRRASRPPWRHPSGPAAVKVNERGRTATGERRGQAGSGARRPRAAAPGPAPGAHREMAAAPPHQRAGGA